MTNKEQIKKDLPIALDFVGQIIDNPALLDKIPEGAEITFLDEGNIKTERPTHCSLVKKYVKVNRYFEVL